MLVTTRRAVASDAESVAERYLRARRAATSAGTIPALVHADDEVRPWVADLVVPKLDCWIGRSPNALRGMLMLEREWIDQLIVIVGALGGGS